MVKTKNSDFHAVKELWAVLSVSFWSVKTNKRANFFSFVCGASYVCVALVSKVVSLYLWTHWQKFESNALLTKKNHTKIVDFLPNRGARPFSCFHLLQSWTSGLPYSRISNVQKFTIEYQEVCFCFSIWTNSIFFYSFWSIGRRGLLYVQWQKGDIFWICAINEPKLMLIWL